MAEGECFLCNEFLTKRGMSRHLEACQKESFKAEEEGSTIHLRVQGRYRPDYWMHLAVKPETTLEELDSFLRDIWLECCGHMSAFTIGKTRYTTGAGIDAMWADMEFVPRSERSMGVRIGEVLRPKLEFLHEYDFGSTTELSLKVVSRWEGQADEQILVLARNKPPSIECSCGNQATKVCGIHARTARVWLCEGCAPEHECGEDVLLPVVNSPRMGKCGYLGSDVTFEQSSSGGLKPASDEHEK